eukprot:237982_1
MKTSHRYLWIILTFSVIMFIVLIIYNQQINLDDPTKEDPIQIGIKISNSNSIRKEPNIKMSTTKTTNNINNTLINIKITNTVINHTKIINFIPKINKPLSQPSLVIVASINAGTSTINRILMYNFKHYFHKFRDLEDMYYFIGCTPMKYVKYIENTHNRNINTSFKWIYNNIKNESNNIGFYSWNASFSNLKSRGCRDKYNNNSYHCNIKCTHNNYMEHIGYNRQLNTIKFSDHFFDNLEDINNTNQYKYYPNERMDEIYFYWDRTSGYNSLPY